MYSAVFVYSFLRFLAFLLSLLLSKSPFHLFLPSYFCLSNSKRKIKNGASLHNDNHPYKDWSKAGIPKRVTRHICVKYSNDRLSVIVA